MSDNKICEKCGAEFGCGVKSKDPCWCMGYNLTEKSLEDLKAKYNDCLCPDCLKTMESK